jgi:hypothetical protein
MHNRDYELIYEWNLIQCSVDSEKYFIELSQKPQLRDTFEIYYALEIPFVCVEYIGAKIEVNDALLYLIYDDLGKIIKERGNYEELLYIFIFTSNLTNGSFTTGFLKCSEL